MDQNSKKLIVTVAVAAAISCFTFGTVTSLAAGIVLTLSAVAGYISFKRKRDDVTRRTTYSKRKSS